MSPCCPRCGVSTLQAVTLAGYAVTLDAAPITALEELRARVAGRPTYTRHTFTGAVAWRAPRTIRARPAGVTPRQTVHTGHACPPAPATPADR